MILSHHVLKSELSVLYIFKQLFAANQNKPADIANILVANKSKLLRLLGELKTDKGTSSTVLSMFSCLE